MQYDYTNFNKYDIRNSINYMHDDPKIDGALKRHCRSLNISIGKFIDCSIQCRGIERFYIDLKQLNTNMMFFTMSLESTYQKNKRWSDYETINKYLNAKKMPTFICKDILEDKKTNLKFKEDFNEYKRKQSEKQIELDLFDQ